MTFLKCSIQGVKHGEKTYEQTEYDTVVSTGELVKRQMSEAATVSWGELEGWMEGEEGEREGGKRGKGGKGEGEEGGEGERRGRGREEREEGRRGRRGGGRLSTLCCS